MSEAERWAGLLEHEAQNHGPTDYKRRAAAELRRLEAEVEALRKALEKYRGQLNQHGEHSAADDLDAALAARTGEGA